MSDRTFTATEKLAELIAERGYRQRVYPRLVLDRKMTQAKAAQRMAILEAIIADYRAAEEKERSL